MDTLETITALHVMLLMGSLSQCLLERKTWTLRPVLIFEIYTICVLIAATTFLLYELFTDDDDISDDSSDPSNSTNDNEIGRTVNFIQALGIRIAHIVTIGEAFWRRHDQIKFFELVREIDKIFERSLNVVIDDNKYRRSILQNGIFMLIIYIGPVIFVFFIKWFAKEESLSLFWLFYLPPFCVCGMRYFQIFVAITVIKRRFEELVHVMSEINLISSDSKGTNDSGTTDEDRIQLAPPPLHTIKLPMLEPNERAPHRRFDMENPELKRLLIIRDLYNRLWELAAIVNRCFGLSMLINVGNDFVTITSNCYWMFLNFKQYAAAPLQFLHMIVGSAVWSMPHFFNVLALAIICERAVQSTAAVALSLHRIAIDIFNDNHNTVIEQFSLQLLHQKMTFTAAGFFNINCTLLYTIAGATTTYLIILIQFHMSEQKSSTMST